jgi:enamine deaminase RidA (YjgF/YER057c/UK114 family)
MTAWAIALLLVSGQVAPAPNTRDVDKESWHHANRLCWQDVEVDGSSASVTEVKVACIALGILTQRLIDGGYCLNARKNDWERC